MGIDHSPRYQKPVNDEGLPCTFVPGTALTSPVIAIGSGKGGVGKTWVAISLAQTLTDGGGHSLLMDCDLNLANVDVQLGLTPKVDLGGVINGRIPLTHAVTPNISPGMDIIAGRSGGLGLETTTTATLLRLERDIADIRTRYDNTLIDLASGLTSASVHLAAAAHRVLVVVTDDPGSMANAFSFIRACHHEHLGRNRAKGEDGPRGTLGLETSGPNHRDIQPDIRIVINMASSREAGEKTFDIIARACRSLLNADVQLAGVIRFDDHVRDAIRNQAPFMATFPGSPAARDVRALADGLLKK